MEGTENKKELLDLVENLWEKYPKQRFGQLLENYVFNKDEMFYQEDERTLQRINSELDEFLKNKSPPIISPDNPQSPSSMLQFPKQNNEF